MDSLDNRIKLNEQGINFLSQYALKTKRSDKDSDFAYTDFANDKSNNQYKRQWNTCEYH